MKKIFFLIIFLFCCADSFAQHTLTVRVGGTGNATLGANQLLLGNGTAAILSLANSSEGTVLTISGGVPAWTVFTGLPSQIGNSGKFLTTDGANASWAAVSASGTVTTFSTSLSGLSVTNQTTTPALSGTLGISSGGTGQVTANLALNALLPSQAGANGKVLQSDGANTSWQTGGGGSGTVTSVGLSLPNIFTVSGSPVTTSGTLTAVLASQSQNLFLSSPNGSSGTPSFRSIVSADVPTLNQNTTGSAATLTTARTINGTSFDGSTNITLGSGSVTLAQMANIADQTILGNNSGGSAAPIALTAAQTKTVLSLGAVENTALSTWAGTTNITTLGTIGTGTWNGTKIAEGFGGTNQSTYTKGDILYSSAANTLSKLAGNTTATKQYLSQTGTGVISAAPAWATIANTDITGLGTSSTHATSDFFLVANNLSEGTASTIRSNISAAQSGANTDITSVLLNQTGLVVKGATANALTIKPNETMSAGRTLNIITGDASRSLTFSGDATISGTNTGDATLSGENYLSLSGQAFTAHAVDLSGTNATGILAAARFPALTGDVTTSSGALGTTIASNAVTTSKINNSAVTLAKIANAAANSVLVGSGSSGTGSAYTEITLGGGLSMSLGVLSSSTSSGANPSATIGLSANNGSASTFMRSDGTPALGVTIAPTWTGVHNFLSAGIASTYTTQINLENTTLSTSGTKVQQSPSLEWLSHVWSTTATAADSTSAFTITNIPITSANPLTSNLTFQAGNGGTNMVTEMQLSNLGVLNLATGYQIAGAATSTNYLRGNGTNFVSSAIQAGDVPTLNQNTTGSAAKWTTARNLAGNSTDGSANVAFANTFIVQGTADAGLSAAQFLGALGTGIVKNTTTTGVLTIAINSDLPVMSATVGGAVPSPPNDATKYLNGTGAWTVPAGGGGSMAIGGAVTSGTLKSILYIDASGFLAQENSNFTWDYTNFAQTITNTSVAANTIANGMILANSQSATSGNQMYSPFLSLQGAGWKTTATAASQAVQWNIGAVPVQGTTNPTSILGFYSNINGAGNSEVFGFTSAGGLRVNGSALSGILVVGTNGILAANPANSIYYDGTNQRLGIGSGMSTPSTPLHVLRASSTTNAIDKIITLGNNSSGTPAANAGVGLYYTLKSSTTNNRDVAMISGIWTTATEGSQTSALTFQGVNAASALTEMARLSLTAATTATLTLGVAGTTLGNLALTGNTSGTITLTGAAAAGTWTWTVPTTGGTKGYLLQTDGAGVSSWRAPNNYQATPADPTGITSTTVQMLGLAGSITPTGTGAVMIVISGQAISSLSSRSPTIQIYYGTSTAPTNGAAVTGTAIGNVSGFTDGSVSGIQSTRYPFTCNAIVTGLTANTAYWIDLGAAEPTSGTVTITSVSISVFEF